MRRILTRVTQQAFVVTERAHPWGEAGVRMSLDEVAQRIARGMNDPYVRTYAIEKLSEAKRRGENIDSPRARFNVLLRVMQTEKIWVPDPQNAEYIPEARLLACDPKNPHKTPDGKTMLCVAGDDCDGKTVALGAMLGSVGIHVMVVGHGYDGDRVEHVLLAAWLDGKWVYGDPSLEQLMPGERVPFSWERLLSVPNVRVICNASACLTGNESSYNPDESNFVTEGRFIGVGGVRSLVGLRSKVVWESRPTVDWIERARVQWLGQVPENANNAQTGSRELTTIEKATIAGTIISAVGLAITLYDRSKRKGSN